MTNEALAALLTEARRYLKRQAATITVAEQSAIMYDLVRRLDTAAQELSAESRVPSESPRAVSPPDTEQEKLAKIGARVLQMIDLSHDCSEAVLIDVVQDVVTRGTVAREEHKKRAFMLGDFRPREG